MAACVSAGAGQARGRSGRQGAGSAGVSKVSGPAAEGIRARKPGAEGGPARAAVPVRRKPSRSGQPGSRPGRSPGRERAPQNTASFHPKQARIIV